MGPHNKGFLGPHIQHLIPFLVKKNKQTQTYPFLTQCCSKGEGRGDEKRLGTPPADYLASFALLLDFPESKQESRDPAPPPATPCRQRPGGRLATHRLVELHLLLQVQADDTVVVIDPVTVEVIHLGYNQSKRAISSHHPVGPPCVSALF